MIKDDSDDHGTEEKDEEIEGKKATNNNKNDKTMGI
jgi:hypothetical protein